MYKKNVATFFLNSLKYFNIIQIKYYKKFVPCIYQYSCFHLHKPEKRFVMCTHFIW